MPSWVRRSNCDSAAAGGTGLVSGPHPGAVAKSIMLVHMANAAPKPRRDGANCQKQGHKNGKFRYRVLDFIYVRLVRVPQCHAILDPFGLAFHPSGVLSRRRERPNVKTPCSTVLDRGPGGRLQLTRPRG